jgi:hypothetical protein
MFDSCCCCCCCSSGTSGVAIATRSAKSDRLALTQHGVVIVPCAWQHASLSPPELCMLASRLQPHQQPRKRFREVPGRCSELPSEQASRSLALKCFVGEIHVSLARPRICCPYGLRASFADITLTEALESSARVAIALCLVSLFQVSLSVVTRGSCKLLMQPHVFRVKRTEYHPGGFHSQHLR